MTDHLDLYRKQGLYLATVGRKGRGVFCDRDIAADEIIEITPAMTYPAEQMDAVKKTLFSDYAFADITTQPHGGALAMGLISFCNHLAAANATYDSQRTPDGLFFTLRALQDIPAHTEICINYGLAWFPSRNAQKPPTDHE